MLKLWCLVIVQFSVLLQVVSADTAPRWHIRAGTAVSFPGVVVIDGSLAKGELHGYSAIIDCMAQQLQAGFSWQQFPTARLVQAAVQSKVDIIFPMGFTSERSRVLQASDYLVQEQDYWGYIGSAPDWSQKQLSIAVKQASPQAEWLAQNGYINIHQVYDYKQLLPLLRSGRVQAISVPAAIAVEYQVAAFEDLSLQAYFNRDAGFYLNHDFARAHLQHFNQAIAQCRHLAVLQPVQ